jgi:hypothetical protein
MAHDLVQQSRELLFGLRLFRQILQRSPKKAKTARTTTTNPTIVRILYILFLLSWLRQPRSTQRFDLAGTLCECLVTLDCGTADRLWLRLVVDIAEHAVDHVLQLVHA